MSYPEDTPSTEAGAVASLARLAAVPAELSPGRIYALPDGAGGLRMADTYGYASSEAGRPTRKRGTVEVHTADAFSWYVAKHGLAETELYADTRTSTLVGVLNAHGGAPLLDGKRAIEQPMTADDDDAEAGWGDHRVVLRLHKTPAWRTWEKLDRQLIGQVDFAEHVEDRLVDFKSPTGADMLEVAQTFQASRSAAFESSTRLASGEVKLGYREDTQASAGRQGGLQVPERFELGLVPFEGGQPYKVTARFRYRISGGTLRVGYLLDRPEDILRAAFLDEVLAVHTATGRTIINGVPAQ